MASYKVVFLRHGESLWNKENRFTGWTDVDLSEKGVEEAHQAGKLLKAEGYDFDVAYTSVLKRAIRTLWISLYELNLHWIPVIKSWRLNERHYGNLQGLNKSETAEKFGEEQVFIWRRSYDTPPEALNPEDERHPRHDKTYAKLDPKDIPASEALKQTKERVLPFWKNEIAPAIQRGEKVIVAAHGNSLRALIKHLDNISDEEITKLNIPTGIPLVYELDEQLKPIKHYYLGDAEEIKKAADKVANQARQ